MIGLPDEAPVPLQPDRGKRISPFNDLEGQFQQPVSTSKDMSGNLKVHDTTHLETQTWEPTPLPLLERNALMAHPDRLVVCEIQPEYRKGLRCLHQN